MNSWNYSNLLKINNCLILEVKIIEQGYYHKYLNLENNKSSSFSNPIAFIKLYKLDNQINKSVNQFRLFISLYFDFQRISLVNAILIIILKAFK